jgi:hypothetical protein
MYIYMYIYICMYIYIYILCVCPCISGQDLTWHLPQVVDLKTVKLFERLHNASGMLCILPVSLYVSIYLSLNICTNVMESILNFDAANKNLFERLHNASGRLYNLVCVCVWCIYICIRKVSKLQNSKKKGTIAIHACIRIYIHMYRWRWEVPQLWDRRWEDIVRIFETQIQPRSGYQYFSRCVYIYLWVCSTYTHTHIHTYIYTHIHAYIHTYIELQGAALIRKLHA